MADHFISYNIHNGIIGIKHEGNTLRTRKDSANQSHLNASGCNTAHGIGFCVQRAPLSSVQGHAWSGVDYRPVNTFVDSVFGENTQLCN